MNIERVYYQRNFRISPVADPFLYESIGVGIIVNDGEDAKLAMDEAKRLVVEYQGEHMIIEHPHIEIRTILPGEDKEFEALKAAIEGIEYKEDAQAYLDTTDYKHAWEAKNLIKNKPSKT